MPIQGQAGVWQACNEQGGITIHRRGSSMTYLCPLQRTGVAVHGIFHLEMSHLERATICLASIRNKGWCSEPPELADRESPRSFLGMLQASRTAASNPSAQYGGLLLH